MIPTTLIELEQYLNTLPEMKPWYHQQSGEVDDFDHQPLQNRAGEILENVQRVLKPDTDESYREIYRPVQEAFDQGDFKERFPHALDYQIICLQNDEVGKILERRKIN